MIKRIQETAYDKDLDEKKPVTVTGVKGLKSKPFKKRFKHMDHFRKWAEKDGGDHEIHYVYNEEFDAEAFVDALLEEYTPEEIEDMINEALDEQVSTTGKPGILSRWFQSRRKQVDRKEPELPGLSDIKSSAEKRAVTPKRTSYDDMKDGGRLPSQKLAAQRALDWYNQPRSKTSSTADDEENASPAHDTLTTHKIATKPKFAPIDPAAEAKRRREKAMQTKSLRKTFGVAPGRRKNLGEAHTNKQLRQAHYFHSRRSMDYSDASQAMDPMMPGKKSHKNRIMSDHYAKKAMKHSRASMIAHAMMKKRGMTEEAEQINEISKTTLGNYIKRAVDDVRSSSYTASTHDNLAAANKGNVLAPEHAKVAQKLYNKSISRQKGIGQAVDRLKGEFTNQKVDATTLGGNIVKRPKRYHGHSFSGPVREESVEVLDENKHHAHAALMIGGGHTDSISKNKEGNYVFRKGYFYHNGATAEGYANHVSNALTKAGVKHEVVHHEDIWKPFKGGASTRNQSHLAAHIKIHDWNNVKSHPNFKEYVEDSKHNLDESIESLDEISRDTLKNYVKKGVDSLDKIDSNTHRYEKNMRRSQKRGGLEKYWDDLADKSDKKYNKRTKYLKKAVHKIAYEEVQPLDERAPPKKSLAHKALTKIFATITGKKKKTRKSPSRKTSLVVNKNKKMPKGSGSGVTLAKKNVKKPSLAAQTNSLRKTFGVAPGKRFKNKPLNPKSKRTTTLVKSDLDTTGLENKMLTELSRKTLGSYVKKASKNLDDSARWQVRAQVKLGKTDSKAKKASWYPIYNKHGRKVTNRLKGISRATDRLQKEEVEQLDEISKKLAKRYAKKAVDSHGHANFAARNSSGKEKEKYSRIENNRKLGISRAVKKMDEDVSIEEAIKMKLRPGLNARAFAKEKKAVLAKQTAAQKSVTLPKPDFSKIKRPDPDENNRGSRMLKGNYPWGKVSNELAKTAISRLRNIAKPEDRLNAMDAIWHSHEHFHSLIKTGRAGHGADNAPVKPKITLAKVTGVND